MRTVNLVTTNDRKVREAKAAFMKFNIKVKQVKLDILEIQSEDPREILKAKVNTAYKETGEPVAVTDTSWNIPSLNGFPGGFMKYVAEWFESSDFLKLVEDKGDKRIAFTEAIAYKDADKLKIFSKEFWGKFANEPRGDGNSIEQIAEFEGFTIGERRERGELSHDPEDYVWFDFAKWFSDK